MILGTAVVLTAFLAGALWGGRTTPEGGATAPLADRLETIEALLAELLRSEGNGTPPVLELAPIPVGGGRELPASRIEALVARLDEVSLRLEELESKGDVTRPGASAPRDWRAIERDVERLRRQTDVPELQRFVERHGPQLDAGKVPLELSFLGVREVLDRFGWPEKMLVPTNANGPYSLEYRLAPEVGNVSGKVVIHCTQFRTFYATIDV